HYQLFRCDLPRLQDIQRFAAPAVQQPFRTGTVAGGDKNTRIVVRDRQMMDRVFGGWFVQTGCPVMELRMIIAEYASIGAPFVGVDRVIIDDFILPPPPPLPPDASSDYERLPPQWFIHCYDTRLRGYLMSCLREVYLFRPSDAGIRLTDDRTLPK